MVHVRLRVGDTEVDVSTNEGTWRSRVGNRLVFRFDGKGGRLIVGIGDRGDQTGASSGTTVIRAFDASDFDADVSVAATRFWALEAQKAGGRHSAVRAWLMRPLVELAWPAWRDIPPDARRHYLRETARFADVTVNGKTAVKWSLLRQVLGLAPEIAV